MEYIHWVVNPLGIATIIGMLIGAGVWIGSVNTDRTSFKDFMAEVRKDIKAILERLPTPVAAGKSPLQLTGLGNKISKSLKAKDWASNIAQELKEQVVDKEAYDIHDFCFNYVSNEMEASPEQEKLLKACAYEAGVNREQVLTVLAIELRDKLLELKL